MEEKYSNPLVRKNRKAWDIANLKYEHFDAALGEITKLQTELKKQYGRDCTSITELKTCLETNRRHASQILRKLNKELENIRNECQHDFKFDGETYTGNFDYYVCTKCGQVDMRKA